MAFPRYEIGDIIEQVPYRYASMLPAEKSYYLILDKKISATHKNMADMYLALCLDNGKVQDQIFQDTWYSTFIKVA